MNFYFVAAFAIAASLATTACATSSPEPTPAAEASTAGASAETAVARMLELQSAMLAIMEANEDDPGAASAALHAFLDEREAELDAVRAGMEELHQLVEVDPARGTELMNRHQAAISAIAERTNALVARAPGLFASPAVQSAVGRFAGGGVVEESDEVAPSQDYDDD